jgi:hypothetical protein
MLERRVTVWVQRFKDRPHLMLQWNDPETGRRKSRSAGTADEGEAERARADLEYELNHGHYREASRMSWERFRELFEQEYVAPTRQNTRRNFTATLDAFEEVCAPKRLSAVCERTISRFAAGLRRTPGRARGSTGMICCAPASPGSGGPAESTGCQAQAPRRAWRRCTAPRRSRSPRGSTRPTGWCWR